MLGGLLNPYFEQFSVQINIEGMVIENKFLKCRLVKSDCTFP